ncbi:L,D-transpeptidase [Jatrophihabitans sp.]|uniref:L,D-transpeptidase n=1 Tax=Jatrophihabitans sp. TaxID=1932789 RepID=UPI0030C6F984|nr:lppS [Jatrophihabitans sp.]
MSTTPATGSSTAATAGGSTTPSAPTTSASSSTQAKTPVHIQLKFSDGSQFGVGIPVIAFFSRKITDATALQAATTLKINGKAVTGGHWYFESSDADPGYPIEGDYRLENYWPAHSSIFVSIPVKGMSAGGSMAYDDSLTSSFSIGASHVATVDNSTHKLTLVTDGKVEGVYPVSLGATDTPTARGTKVIMEKGVSICMTGPGYHDCGVKYTQRLTYGGEYLHSAPWNTSHINNGINSSNGCTNLLPNDAKKLYGILEIGDVVKYPNANGPAMTMGAGYGDWNVSWAQWLTGGDISKI